MVPAKTSGFPVLSMVLGAAAALHGLQSVVTCFFLGLANAQCFASFLFAEKGFASPARNLSRVPLCLLGI